MTGNVKQVYLACGWNAVDTDLLKYWGISRAKETMVQEARREFFQLILLWMDSSSIFNLWKVIADDLFDETIETPGIHPFGDSLKKIPLKGDQSPEKKETMRIRGTY